MLFTFKQPPYVFPAVFPLVETVALLLVCHKLTIVCHFVVLVEPEAFHFLIDPLTMIDFVRPALLAEASDLIVLPLTLVYSSVWVGVFTLSMLLAFFVFSFVSGSTGEVFYTMTMLQVILPLAFILGSFRSLV